MADKITLSIKDFRAIKEANIKLNGITVVSGSYGSGKSTISKFLYYSFLYANEYEKIVNKHLSSRLSVFKTFIEIFRRNVLISDKAQESYHDSALFWDRFMQIDKKEAFLFNMDHLYNIYKQQGIQKGDSHEERYIAILKDLLKHTDDEVDFSSLMQILVSQIADIYDEATQILNHRPLSLLLNELAFSFRDYNLPKEFVISEYNDLIIGNKSKTVSVVHSIREAAYIDTPTILGMQLEKSNDYWDRLNKLLKKQSAGRVVSPSIDQLIRTNIMQGETKYVEDLLGGTFTFTNNSGATYNLQDCATGLKAFSILQLMLRNGFLTPNTLLIIDEPEVHLHPQWIVEYARLIVLLNKEIGVNFFIASHNPDMVSAIKYISEKEGTTNKLNFYLAEEDETDKGRYTYKALGTDIEPIFKSFNIALDKINEYGIADEDDVL